MRAGHLVSDFLMFNLAFCNVPEMLGSSYSSIIRVHPTQLHHLRQLPLDIQYFITVKYAIV